MNIEKYQYKEAVREEYRKNLSIGKDEIIVGHVGRFDIPKNHMFLLDVFEEFLKVQSKAKLVLVGYGKLEKEIREKITKKKLNDKVLILRKKR